MSGNAPGPALTVAVASPLLALWPLCTGRRRVPDMAASGAVPVGALARQLSVLLVAVLTVSVFDAVTLQFLPLYGEAAGLTSGQAAFALTALLVGHILFQFPLGWLADRLGRGPRCCSHSWSARWARSCCPSPSTAARGGWVPTACPGR
ncbi:hypothetical protein AB0P36_20450 [Streptomyces flavidovirens]|uniref:hypothetical protein n=1 Tax=Streptomyces flavidovirens TaxID=67298 RepID=UPI00341ED7C4